MKKRRKKILALLLAASCLSGTLPGNVVLAEEGQTAETESTTDTESAESIEFKLGNSSLNIMNGGTISEEECDITQYIGEASYSDLNVFDAHIYYVSAENAVMMIDRATGAITTVCMPGETIEQLYVVNDSVLYYLAGGNVYTYDITSGTTETLMGTGDVKGFIPTAYGVIYGRGSLFSWSLSAGEAQIAAGVYQYYTQDEYLVYTQDGEEYQALIADLFTESASDVIEIYSLGDTDDVELYSDEEDEDCDVCEANAASYDEELTEASDEVNLGETEEGLISAYATSLSTTQQNMIERARGQADVKWKPVADLSGWRHASTFEAGETVTGVPYGQPVNGWSNYIGAYVPWNATVTEFLDAVDNSNSLMYTTRATYSDSLYYSSDCSSFVSYCWGLSGRNTTYTLARYGTRQSSSVYVMQVGDILLKTSSHVLMVADVTYNSNNEVVSVTTVEQTPPKCRYVVWGEGGTSSNTLEKLASTYLDNGYYIYRSNVSVTSDGSGTVAYGVDVLTDVAAGTWYYDYVDYVYENDYMTGMTSRYFGVSEILKRSHFITILYRIEGEPDVTYSDVFPDVGDGAFYSDAAIWGYNTEVATGYEEGSFGIDDDVTREQLVTMLYRYAEYKGYDPQATGDLTKYPDYGSVPSFATEAMQWAVAEGIITGDGGNLNPQGNASRAVCATIIARYMSIYS